MNAEGNKAGLIVIEKVARKTLTQPEDTQNVKHPDLEWWFRSECVADSILQEHPEERLRVKSHEIDLLRT